MPIKPTIGGSTKLPSLTLRLPSHVTARPRRDGTFRVLFEVRRDRPPGWPSTIPLPRTGRRTGNLDDVEEVARIIRDVEGTPEKNYTDGLLAQLEAARAPATGPPRGSLRELSARWQGSDWWTREIKPRTRNFYLKNLRHLEVWSLSKGDPHAKSLTLPAIIAYLKRWHEKPSMQAGMRRTLSALLSFAMTEGDISVHAFGAPMRLRRNRSIAKREVEVWTWADVEQHRDIANKDGWWPGGALLVWLMWETSADASDIVTWRKGDRGHFRDTAVPAITFTRGKTGERGIIPISRALADAIRANGSLFLVTDPEGRPYAPDDVQDDNRRGRHFMELRDRVVAAGGRRLLADHLRHSAATDAIEKGASLDATTALTLHTNAKMLREIYWQLTERQAAAVQRLRGIIT